MNFKFQIINLKKIFLSLFVVSFLVGNVMTDKVLAADYSAKWKGQSEYLSLTAGQIAKVWVEFENTGNANWYRDSNTAVHLGTANKLDRASLFFEDNSWINNNRIELMQDVVKPGQIGRFEFDIKAPSQSGVYKEYFRPVAENITWLNDQGVYWEFRVNGDVNFEDMCMSRDSSVQTTACTMPEGWMYDSKWNAQSEYLTMKPGETKNVWVEFVNNGEATWYQNGDFALHLGTANPIDRDSLFAYNGWINSNRLKMVQSNVKTGEKAKFEFQIKAPDKAGMYYEYFRPVAENISWLRDDGVFWQIEVVEDSNNNNNNNGNVPEISSRAARVSSDGSFDIYNAYTNQLIKSVTDGNKVSLFNDGKYQIWVGSEYFESPDYVQLRAKNGAILRVDSYSDIKSWNTSLNDNLFRDTIEVRYSDVTDQIWIINELVMEDYLAGMAETSNDSANEYLKAIAVAERTYVTYHKDRGGRHPENYIDLYNSVNGNGDDQVYRGYGFEIRNPNVVNAVKATTEKVVTYNGKIAVTPYFSQSDGRTRSWEEVWGNGANYPWCKSVADPYNEGKSLLGHGVGMSASGARNFADKEGKSYDWILKYYYTGIDITNMANSDKRIRVGIYKL